MESDGEKTIPFLILSRTFYSSHRFENTFVFNLICSFIMASITDYAHRIRFEKVKDTHFTSSSRFQGHPFNFEPRPKLDLAMQTSTSWSKKMSGGYLVLRLSWPPRPSKGGGNLLRHSLDSSLLSSTHIDDKKTIAQRRMHLDKYKV